MILAALAPLLWAVGGLVAAAQLARPAGDTTRIEPAAPHDLRPAA